jgi:uncharacterized protein
MSSRPPDSAPPAFHIMTKPRGAICNLDCQYCYYLDKETLYPGSPFRMSADLLETYVRQYIQAQRVPEVNFAWQGGEPTLMGLDFFRQAAALQKKYQRPGMVITNSLQTNAVNLDGSWAEFFRQHNFLVGVSLDGPAALHDAYRWDKGGGPTHARVMAGIEVLRRHQVDFNILCCIHAANAPYPLEVYRFLRDQVGAQYLQFIPIVERENGSEDQDHVRLTRRSITGKQYGQFLRTVFDEWVRRDVGKVFVQLFDVCLGVWLGKPSSLCVHAETCGLNLAIEHNGDLYSCDHFVQPRHLLGNLQEENLLPLVASEQQAQFGRAKMETLPLYCQECEVRFICNGGCPKDRIRRTPDGEAGLNYLCEGYYDFFTSIDASMKMMRALILQGRPPADIMGLMGDQPPLETQSLQRPARRKKRRR